MHWKWIFRSSWGLSLTSHIQLVPRCHRWGLGGKRKKQLEQGQSVEVGKTMHGNIWMKNNLYALCETPIPSAAFEKIPKILCHLLSLYINVYWVSSMALHLEELRGSRRMRYDNGSRMEQGQPSPEQEQDCGKNTCRCRPPRHYLGDLVKFFKLYEHHFSHL